MNVKEELRQQLGDAQGFGEMQTIFAEAWQLSQGKTTANMKTGQKALEELYDQMKKGNVYAASILPYVAELAAKRAEGGLEEARNSANAERARFSNSMTEGWKSFTDNGGADGMALFWRMATLLGDWFKENGKSLGNMFEDFIIKLDYFRTGISDFFSFMSTGVGSDTIDALAERGLDVFALRNSLIEMWGAVKELFMSIAEAMGFAKDGSITKGLTDKIVTFTNNMTSIIAKLAEMIRSISAAIDAAKQWNNLSFGDKALSFIPFTESSKHLSNVRTSAASAVGSFFGATGSALGTSVDAVIGSNTPAALGTKPISNFGYTPAQMNPDSIMARPKEQVVVNKTEATVTFKLEGDKEALRMLMSQSNQQDLQDKYLAALVNIPNTRNKGN